MACRAKHAPALRPVIPFGDDPYDAVGSFGVIIGMLVAFIALARAFWLYRSAPGLAQRVYLLRSEVAVVLAVYIALAADVIALIRHPSMWVAARSRSELLILLGGMAVMATATLFLLCASREASAPARWAPSIITAIVFVIVLAIYPERLIDATLTHLLTVVIGAVLLFAPMRALLITLVPYEPASRHEPGGLRWGGGLVVGVVVGAFAFIGEVSEGGAVPPLRQLVLVAAVFIVLSIAGMLVAYAFIGALLGFASQR